MPFSIQTLSRGSLGVLLGSLGAILGGLGAVLGGHRAIVDGLEAVLDGLWAILGRLGAVLGGSGGLLGRPKVSQKSDPKIDPKSSRIATEKKCSGDKAHRKPDPVRLEIYLNRF